MKSKLVKWGNGQGIRIPRSLMIEAHIELNEPVTVSAKEGKIVIEKTFQHKTLEERAATFGGKLGPYESFDWGNPVGREVW